MANRVNICHHVSDVLLSTGATTARLKRWQEQCVYNALEFILRTPILEFICYILLTNQTLLSVCLYF